MKFFADSHRTRDTVLVVVFAVLSCALYFVPTGFENRQSTNAVRCRGEIIRTDNSEVMQAGIVKMGIQSLTVKLLDGPFAGREVQADNQLIGKMELDKMFAEGDVALMVLSLQDGDIYFANILYFIDKQIKFHFRLFFRKNSQNIHKRDKMTNK